MSGVKIRPDAIAFAVGMTAAALGLEEGVWFGRGERGSDRSELDQNRDCERRRKLSLVMHG